MKLLNLNHLYYFYIIAKEGSLEDGCEKLRLTPSTLKNRLKDLEIFLGEELFERPSRGLVLNELGRKVLEFAATIFDPRDPRDAKR